MPSDISRRSFITYSLGSLASIALSSILMPRIGTTAIAAPTPAKQLSELIPPLFCIAYIAPDAPGQENQEEKVARYPLTLVPQDNREIYIRWRDKVKELNPSILMLGYQMVIEETTVLGSGHDILRTATDSWCVYPGGYTPTITLQPGNRLKRLFDPRKEEWQDKFLSACRETLRSYPFDGLFLDQCSVFEIAHPMSTVKEEMRQALQNTLLRLRNEFPSALIIGNSSHDWGGLNGELLEGRPADTSRELLYLSEHTQPRVQLYNSRLKDPGDIDIVQEEMALAHSQNSFYGASVDYQHVLWFETFDDLITNFRNTHPPRAPQNLKILTPG